MRPLASLIPGERVRAALIELSQRATPPELLVLDEPADPLDFVGSAALSRILRAWKGGLVVVSHDAEWTESLEMERYIELGRDPRADLQSLLPGRVWPTSSAR